MPDAAARRCLFLRHHDEDDPGLVGAALERRGVSVRVLHVDDDTAPIDLDGVDVLGVLGAKWSVNDHAEIGGWFGHELDAIGEADRRGAAVLGICFGAQALCVATGGVVERAPRRELGWVPLLGAPDDGVPGGPWFQFHEDRCRPSRDATVLAHNEVAVQAFRVGRHLGVQFHPEIDAAQLGRWMDGGAREVVRSEGLDEAALLAETRRREAEVSVRVDALVEGFLARSG